MSDKANGKESKVEGIKRASRHLRGTIAEGLDDGTSKFGKDDSQLLKFHGTYQQDDRDLRHELRKEGKEEAWQFMVRCAIPAGLLTSQQFLAISDLCDRLANGSLRVTTRQGFQLHGVIKKNLKATIKGINDALVTTLSACGDVERNVMGCPAPLADDAHKTIRRVAREIAVQLRPASKAYHEIWLDGEKQITTDQEEPFYGDQYLPRKFKTAIALADDNCVDIYNHDLGLIAMVEEDRIEGFNVLVGGGMGMTHGKEDTFAKLGELLGFVEAPYAVETARTVAAIFRDFGNRADRRHARLKYVIAERGIEWCREEFQRRALFTLHPPRPMPAPCFEDHLGRHEQEDGRYFYGVFIENGRIKNDNGCELKSALRLIAERLSPGIALTPHQNLLFTDLSEAQVSELEKLLSDHGVRLPAELSAARRFSMACPALPTCGLAMAESERIMPEVVDEFEDELTALGLRDEPLTLRMTGCPNGCARPYTADIAFVGRRPDIYHVFVGGGMGGDRVADLYAADVSVPELIPTLRPLLANWAKKRNDNESLSDFYRRIYDRTEFRPYITGKETPTIGLVQLGMPS